MSLTSRLRTPRSLALFGAASLFAFTLWVAVPTFETHFGLNHLSELETLLKLKDGALVEPPDPSVLIVQHASRRGAVSVASHRSHVAYAGAWGYGYSFDTTKYVSNHRHRSLEMMYAVQAAMDAELRKEDRIEWILYCETDSIVRDPSVAVHHLLPPTSLSPTPRILGSEDHISFDSGVMLFRVDQETKDFVDQVISGSVTETPSVSCLSVQHRIHALLRANAELAEYFYQIPNWWLNSNEIHERCSRHRGPWSPRLHERVQRKSIYRPLKHASLVARTAMSNFGRSGKRGQTDRPPVQRLEECKWTRDHAYSHWVQAGAGIRGMRFFDETNSTIIHVP